MSPYSAEVYPSSRSVAWFVYDGANRCAAQGVSGGPTRACLRVVLAVAFLRLTEGLLVRLRRSL